MSQWKKDASAANSVNWASSLYDKGSGNAAKAANNTSMFQNTTPSAVKGNAAIGQFGYKTSAIQNTSGYGRGVGHSGFAMRTAGMGPLATVLVSGTPSGYSNTDYVNVSGGSANGKITFVTNSTGGFSSGNLSIATPGTFANVSSLVFTAANSTGGTSAGTGATFSATLGGRAGRVSFEVLVAGGSLSATANTVA